MTAVNDFTGNSVQMFEVILKTKGKRTNTSEVWNYFGQLTFESRIVFQEKIYCQVCLHEAKTGNSTIPFYRCQIKCFASTVSTGNLRKHLEDVHNIKQQTDVKNVKTLNDFFSTSPSSSVKRAKLDTPTQKKYMLARDLTLWFCRDLLPFDSVSKSGITDFLLKYNIIKNSDELPDRTTLSRTALDDIYNAMLPVIKDKISDGRFGSLTFDTWMDSYRRRSYITFTYHHITDDFQLKSYTLSTKMFPGKHTGSAIENEVHCLKEQFSLQNKDLTVVTDKGSNMVAAIRLGNFQNHFCLGHGLHNLVTVDGFKRVPELQDIFVKVKQIIISIRFKAVDLQKEAEALQLEIERIYELVRQEVEDEDILDDMPLQLRFSSGGNVGNIASLKPSSVRTSSETRWHSALLMFQSVNNQRLAVNNVLEKIDKRHLQISHEESLLLTQLVEFLSDFKKAVEIFSTEKTTSINCALVIKFEIKCKLSMVTDDEHKLISDMKKSMLNNLDNRFPTTDLLVIAAILDPKFKKLNEIESYLDNNGYTSKTDFITKQLLEHKITIATQTQKHHHSNDLNELERENKNNSGNDTTPNVVDSNTSDREYLLYLSKKHSNYLPVETVNAAIMNECQQYLVSTHTADDPLLYWKQEANRFPYLATLAKKILGIPATSTPSERVFSVAGLTISSKRASLSPFNANKIIFIHNNYHIIKECVQ